MAAYNFALILKNPLKEEEFLLLKQTPPPKFNEEEYDSYVDSDLWDLPLTKLNLAEGEKSETTISIQGSEQIDCRKFDVDSALVQVVMNIKSLIWEILCFFMIYLLLPFIR